MPENRREHSKTNSQTAPVQAGRSLSLIRDESAAHVKQHAQQAANGGNPVRVADVKERHEALRKELAKRTDAPGDADRKVELNKAQEVLNALEERQLKELKHTSNAAADAFSMIARLAGEILTNQQPRVKGVVGPSSAAEIQRQAEHQAQSGALQHTMSGFIAAVSQHQSVQANAMRDADRELTEAALSNSQHSRSPLTRTDLMNAILANAQRKSDERAHHFSAILKSFEQELQTISAGVTPETAEDFTKNLDKRAVMEPDIRADASSVRAIADEAEAASMHELQVKSSETTTVSQIQASTGERFDMELVNLNRLNDDLRDLIESRLQGVNKDLVVERVRERIQALRRDQSARLNGQQQLRGIKAVEREKSNLASTPNLPDLAGDKAVDLVQDNAHRLDRQRGALKADMAAEQDAVVREVHIEIGQWEIARTRTDADIKEQRQKDTQALNERWSELSEPQEAELKAAVRRLIDAEGSVEQQLARSRAQLEGEHETARAEQYARHGLERAKASEAEQTQLQHRHNKDQAWLEAQQRRQLDALREEQTAVRQQSVAWRADASNIRSDATHNSPERTAAKTRALHERAQHLREHARRPAISQSVDVARTNRINERVEAAESRNEERLATLDSVRTELLNRRTTINNDAQKTATLDGHLSELDQRIDAYKARGKAIKQTANLVEQRRLDLADRFLDQLEVADSIRRRRGSNNETERELVANIDQIRNATVERQSTSFAILDRRFSEVKPIKELWTRAATAAKQNPALQGRELYDRTMAGFKKLLADETDGTAREARQLFEQDGFRLLRDSQGRLKEGLPVLNDPHVESRLDMTRHSDLLRISGQHLTKIEDKGDPVDANNLLFMIARDNIQMDVSRPLAEYVRQNLVDNLRAARPRKQLEDVFGS